MKVQSSEFRVQSSKFGKTLFLGKRFGPVARMAALENLKIGPTLTPNEAEDALSDILLSDPNPIVRHEAAFKISALKQTGSISGIMAIKALARAASDPSILVRHEVALALASFPGEEAFRVLSALRSDKCEDVVVSAEFALEDLEFRP